MVQAPLSATPSPAPPNPSFTIPDILAGQTVLVTGGAGFIGSAILNRLIDPALSIRRVYTIIRGHGKDPVARLPAELRPHVAKVDSDGNLDNGPIVVLGGDCSLPGFGLSDRENKWLEEVEIVIHTAGDTRFTMSLQKAIKAISDLAYAMCLFTIGSPKVRTHIHLSTCFTGWFLPSGSVVYEELVPPLNPNIQYDEHANTYLHAKTIAEGVVNAIGRTQGGRPASKVNWRILRLSTVGPAISFPVPGWGAGHTSSPVNGSIAAMVGDDSLYLAGAELDVVPVDIAVNQVLGLTASVHAQSRIPALSSCRFPPLPHGANIPIYNIAAGTKPNAGIPILMLNKPEVKLRNPYVPVKNLLAVYKPMITKIVKFDTRRTWRVLGLGEKPQENGNGVQNKYKNGGYRNGDSNAGMTTANASNGDVVSPSWDTIMGTRNVDCAASAFGLTVAVTDPPIDTSGFEVDVGVGVARCGGWMKYLQLVRDKMEEREEEDSFEGHVD